QRTGSYEAAAKGRSLNHAIAPKIASEIASCLATGLRLRGFCSRNFNRPGDREIGHLQTPFEKNRKQLRSCTIRN
ncbi:MAG: hypothetical protein GDA48_07550, partial [Hormoscilla sp. GM102CHS1]|nr:hypothetical protein [Hormoscilla sp. GM102CHS1]